MHIVLHLDALWTLDGKRGGPAPQIGMYVVRITLTGEKRTHYDGPLYPGVP